MIDYVEQARDLLSRGYPLPEKDPYKLAKILEEKAKCVINKSDTHLGESNEQKSSNREGS